MDKDFIYPIFWKGGLYTSRTRLGKEDYLLLKDDNGNLFNVPASEVILKQMRYSMLSARRMQKHWKNFTPSRNDCVRSQEQLTQAIMDKEK